MKKKSVLLILPALMVLPSCANASIQSRNSNIMVENTLANEDIFGEAEQMKFEKKEARKLDPLSKDFVKVGYQIKFDENDEGTADDTISIRFVAAIKNEGVTAYWHRGLAQANGYEGAAPDGVNWKFKFNDGITNQSTVKYTALNNGATRIVAGEGEFADYSHFVIYTLKNIPYETYKDAYLAAYVTLTDTTNGENVVNSKGVAVKVEKNGTASKNRFYFNPDITGHFLQGTINGVLRDGSDDSTNSLLRATEYNTGDNYAAYYNTQLTTSDSFGSFYFSLSCFQFFGYTGYFTDESYFDESSSLAGFVSPKVSGKYHLYLSADEEHELENHVYTTPVYDWSVKCGESGTVVHLEEDENERGKFSGELSVTAGQTIHIFKDGVEDESTYSVTEDVLRNNVTTEFIVKISATSTIYLNNDKSVWLSIPSDTTRTISINLGGFDATNDDVFYVWAWGGGHESAWYQIDVENKCVTIPANCENLQVVRMNSNAVTVPSWDAKWNQTDTMNIQHGKCLSFNRWHVGPGDSGNAVFDWVDSI